MTLEEVQKDFDLQALKVQQVSNEVERLKQQLASEKRNAADTSMELQALKLELEKSKNEAEHLRLMERQFEERRYMRTNSRLELEDAKNTITELKEELSYKSSVNRSLGLQLEKTIESNSELLLEIKDLDDLLQRKEKEIEELKDEIEKRQGSQRAEGGNEGGLLKAEKFDKTKKEPATESMSLQVTPEGNASDDSIQGISANDEWLQKEFEEAKAEILSTSNENAKLLSRLMDLQHETDGKCSQVKQLEQRLAMVQAQASINIDALEAKVNNLLADADDLRENLRLSEEMSQSQLESNKNFMADLIASVEELQDQKEELESSLNNSDKKQACMAEELEALQKDLQAHEKERSLLISQRGQLKSLREKITSLTENNEIAVKRGEDLELTLKALREEYCQAVANLNEHVKQLEGKLQDATSECNVLKAGLQNDAAMTCEQTNLLLLAKEAAEAKSNSLDAAYKELQEQYNLCLLEKEKAMASSLSLQAAHAALQVRLNSVEQGGGETLRELQERDIEIAQLTEALNEAQSQLKGARDKASDLELTISILQEDTKHLLEKERLRNSHVENLQLEIDGMQESLTESRISLVASEDRVSTLEMRNGDLSEMLQSAVSFKEDVVSRLERAVERQLELETKLKETELAFDALKCEKTGSDHAIEDLQERLRILKEEKGWSLKGKDEDKDVRELHKILRTQVEVMKHSMRELKLEKERAESSAQKFQSANANLVKELKKWKDKVKAGTDELALWKEKVRTSKRFSAYSEEKTSQTTDLNTNGARKSTDLNAKSDLLKIRKQAADLRRKLLEQEEEKEDLKRKLSSCQKELQRKEEFVNAIDKRKKEKVGPRSLTRQISGTSRGLGLALFNGEKIPTDLIDRIKSLEAELNIKTVELEAAQFLLKDKDTFPHNEIHVCQNEGIEQNNIATWHERSDDSSSQVQQNKPPLDVDSHRAVADDLQKLLMENERLQRLLMEKNENKGLEDDVILEGSDQGVPQRGNYNEGEQCAKNIMTATDLQEELREIKDRYYQMSLQFAELQAEKEELLMKIRNLS